MAQGCGRALANNQGLVCCYQVAGSPPAITILECWPYFSVAGDQQGCDFNSHEFDGIRNFNPIEFDNFKRVIFMSEQSIESEIQAKGLNAPRLTPADIDSKILGADYHRFNGTTVTICCLYLANGFTVTGESACASPENFDEEIGRKIAYSQAREKIWQLEGYLLRQCLHDEEMAEAK